MHPPGVMRPPPGYRQQPPPSSRQLLGNFYDDEDTSPERGQGRQLVAGDGRSMTLITPDTFTVLPPFTPPPEPVIRPPPPVVKPSQNVPSRTQASSRPFSTNSPPYRRGRKASFVILTAQDPRLPGSASSSRNVSPERPSFGPGLAPNQTQRKPSRIPRSQPVSREPSPTRRRSLGNLQHRGSLSPIKHTAASLKRLQVARSRPSSPKAQHRQPPARRPSKRFVQNNQPDSPSKIPLVNKNKEVNNNNKQHQPKKTSITESKKQTDTRNHTQSSAGAKTQSNSAPETKKDTQSASETKSQSNSTTEQAKKQPQVKKTSLNGTNRQSTVFRKNSNLHPVAGKPPLPPGAGRGRAGAKNSTSTKPAPGVGRGRKESDTRVLINPTMASAPASTDTPATNSRPPGDQTTTTTSTTSTTAGLAPSAGASIVSITTHPALELAGEVAVTAAAALPASQDPVPVPATTSGDKTNGDNKSSSAGKDDKPSENKGVAAAATVAPAASAKSATTKPATVKPTSVKSSAASKKTEPEAAAGTGVDGAAGGEEAAVTEAVGASLESVRTATSETTIRAASSPRAKKRSTETEATSEAVIQGDPDLETLSANVKQAALPEPNTGGSTSTQPPPEPVKQKGGILARLGLRDAGGMKECCRRCCCCCCRKGSNAAAAAAGDRRKSNATTTTSKKQSRSSSTAVEPDTRPKLDPSLMEHGSLIRSAIPVLPLPLAWICLIFNILVPGFGTITSGLFCLCFGKPRLTQRDDPQGRISTFILNIFVSALQMFTVVFCFVGWGWSIWWGIIMVKVSRKYRKLKRAEAASQRVQNQLATPATVQQNHDPERGVP